MLDDFLTGLTEEGKLDSEGSFTLDPAKAALKLKKFRLAGTGDYLLKLVQAAVSAGASRMHVHLTRGEVTVDFELQSTIFDHVVGIGKLLVEPDSAPEGPLRYLAVGLAAATALPHQRLAFAVLRADSGEALWLQDGEARWGRIQDRQGYGTERLCRFQMKRATSWTTWRAGNELVKAEFQTLWKRCRLVPLRLVVNRAQVFSPGHDEAPLLEDRVTAATESPGFFWPSDFGSLTRVDDGVWIKRKKFLRRSLPRLYRHKGAASDRLRLMMRTTGPSRSDGLLRFVIDGVESRPIDLPGLPVDAWIAADGLKTDISGLEIARNAQYESLRSELQERFQELKMEFVRRHDTEAVSFLMPLLRKDDDARSGTVVANFILLERSGQDLYSGMDYETGRPVWVKLLHPDEEHIRRVERESQVWAKLSHPGAAPQRLIKQGDDHYLVLSNSPTLADRLKKDCDYESALSMISQCADVLAYLHEKGVILGNLSLFGLRIDAGDRLQVEGPLGAQGESLNLDLHRHRDWSRPETLDMVRFAAPEMITGQTPRNPGWDQYSLGILTYRLLTGRFPFQAEDVMQTLVAQLQEIPEDPRTLVPTLPEHQAQAILRALRKDPKDRFPSVREFADEFFA